MKYRTILVFYAFFLLLALKNPAKSLATTYYVSPNGSDNNSSSQATNLATSWKTIQKAVNNANPGDTVEVKGGTYNEAVAISKGGTASARITITAVTGESPIIDGSSLGSLSTDGLVQIRDNVNYVTFNGFIVKKSPDMGIANRGSNNIISNNKIILSYDTAIWHRFGVNTQYIGNEAYYNDTKNATQANESGIVCSNTTSNWPAALNSERVSGINTIWKNNIVHNNCGEGIVANNNDQIIGNTFYDNWSINIYLDEATNVKVDSNLVYETNTTYISRGSDNNYKNLAAGLYVSDEITCLAKDNAFTNNIVINARYGFGFYPYSSCSGIINTKIINNTIINSWDYAIRIAGTNAANSNSVIANNLVYSTRGKALLLENPSDLEFYNNLWYITNGDSTGQFQWGSSTYNYSNWTALNTSSLFNNYWIDPQIVGNISQASYLADQYALKDSSPAINSGISSGISDIPSQDYFGLARKVGSSVDIGAIEHTASQVTNKPGDLNLDGIVNLLDFNLLITNFGNPYTILDFNKIISNYSL